MLDSSAESADSPPFRLPKRHRQLSLNAEMKMANNKIPATISQNMGSEMFTSRRGNIILYMLVRVNDKQYRCRFRK